MPRRLVFKPRYNVPGPYEEKELWDRLSNAVQTLDSAYMDALYIVRDAGDTQAAGQMLNHKTPALGPFRRYLRAIFNSLEEQGGF
jgi:hypothetical protein